MQCAACHDSTSKKRRLAWLNTRCRALVDDKEEAGQLEGSSNANNEVLEGHARAAGQNDEVAAPRRGVRLRRKTIVAPEGAPLSKKHRVMGNERLVPLPRLVPITGAGGEGTLYIGHVAVHYSHCIHMIRGYYFCTLCGRYASMGLKRNPDAKACGINALQTYVLGLDTSSTDCRVGSRREEGLNDGRVGATSSIPHRA